MLPIKDLNFGKLDSKAEVIADAKKAASFFSDSFVMPPGLNLSGLYDDNYYYVIGLKGCGKTALLRHYRSKKESEGNLCDLILFKQEFSEADKKNLNQFAGTTGIEKDEIGAANTYKEGWYWVLLQQIHSIISFNLKEAEKVASGYKPFLKLMKEVFPDSRPSLVRKLASFFEGATLKISSDMKFAEAELGIDLNFRKDQEINKNELLDIAIRLATAMKPVDGKRIYIFVDEIEAAYGSLQAYRRDCEIIRDLLVVIAELNNQFITKNTPITIVAAVRSEIAHSVEIAGGEVNRLIDDHGITVKWIEKIGPQHPLIQVIENKIRASEKAVYRSVKTEGIWEAYMPKTIRGQPSWKYLLNITWFKPRDFVRLFNIIREGHLQKEKLTEEMFLAASKDYARASWRELIEEIQANYTTHDINALRLILVDCGLRFSQSQFVSKAELLKPIYESVGKLLDKKRPYVILDDLFRCGVLGNIYKAHDGKNRFRWVHRGDVSRNYEEELIVHPSIVPEFGKPKRA